MALTLKVLLRRRVRFLRLASLWRWFGCRNYVRIFRIHTDAGGDRNQERWRKDLTNYSIGACFTQDDDVRDAPTGGEWTR